MSNSFVDFFWLDRAVCQAYFGIFKQVLGREEQVVCAQLTHPHRREMFVLGHGLLRYVLADYNRCALSDVVLQQGASGKWVGVDQPWHFSLSHSGQVVCLAITRAGAVGVDVECYRPSHTWDCIARRFFSTHEQSVYAALDAQSRFHYGYQIWVGKEAWLKARGYGVFTMSQAKLDDPNMWFYQGMLLEQYCFAVAVKSAENLRLTHQDSSRLLKRVFD